MQVSQIKLYNSNPYNFRAKKDVKPETEYENPVNRNTEKNLAILGSVGASALAGATAFGITTCLKGGRKIPAIVGLITTGISLALTLPSKLYNTKISSFTREKEMNVYSRQKEAQKGIYGEIDKQVADPDVPLEDKIKNYATTVMADNGKGVMIKGA